MLHIFPICLFTHLSELVCLYLLVIMNPETVNMTMQVFFVSLLSTLLEGCGLEAVCPLKAHVLLGGSAKWLHHEGSDLINGLAMDRLMF